MDGIFWTSGLSGVMGFGAYRRVSIYSAVWCVVPFEGGWVTRAECAGVQILSMGVSVVRIAPDTEYASPYRWHIIVFNFRDISM